MANLTKPQRKQLEKQISEAQEKLRQDDIKKCLEQRSKAIYKAILQTSSFKGGICDDLLSEKYSNAVIEQAFFNSIIEAQFMERFRYYLDSLTKPIP